MGPEQLVFLIPIVAIAGGMTLKCMRMWMEHREKIQRLKLEQIDRQAEVDRELLGLTGGSESDHLAVVLDRLNTIEQRLADLDPTESTRAPSESSEVQAPAEDAPHHRRRDENTNVA